MGLIERVGSETEAFHSGTEEDTLFHSATAASYRAYLMRMLGFVLPSERSILSTPGIQRYVNVRRFQKHQQLRRDLAALRMTPEQISELPQCSVPLFDTPEEALGWAYPIERSTLRHGHVFRHFASVIPVELAYASSYLRCYFEMTDRMWRDFGRALAAFETDAHQEKCVIESAKASFRCYRAWQFMQNQRDSIARFRRPFRARLAND